MHYEVDESNVVAVSDILACFKSGPRARGKLFVRFQESPSVLR